MIKEEVIIYLVYIIMSIVVIITPTFSRRDVFFGVKIPPSFRKKEEYKKVFINFLKYETSAIGVNGAIFMWIYSRYSNEIVLAAMIMMILPISYIGIYYSYKKAKELKASENLTNKKTQVVIDTELSRNRSKFLISPMWFIIPIIIVIFNVIITYNLYDRIGDVIATKWSITGEVIKTAPKSYRTAFLIPFSQAISTALMFFVYKGIAWSKNQLRSKNTKKSIERLKNNKRRMSIMLLVILIVMMLQMTINQLQILGVAPANSDVIVTINLVVPIILFIVIIYMVYRAIKDNKEEEIEDSENLQDYIENDDDRYWKLGMFYVNKNDPSIFVEKRYGIGYTVNFGRIESILMFAALIVIIIVMANI